MCDLANHALLLFMEFALLIIAILSLLVSAIQAAHSVAHWSAPFKKKPAWESAPSRLGVGTRW